MKSTIILALTLTCSPVLFAHPHPEGAATPTHQHDPAHEALIEKLLGQHKNLESLQKTIDQARTAGISDQAILEARFIYFVDRNDENQIADLAPEFTKLRNSFKPEQSLAFASKDDLLAVTEYALALHAKRKGNLTDFKKHITEAFWLSPEQGSIYAPLIEKVRLKDAMSRVKLDPSMTLSSAKNKDQSSTLKQLIQSNKAILLHFWSPSSAECEATLPDFHATAKELATHQIASATILSANDATDIDSIPGDTNRFLVDSSEKPLNSLLSIRNLPAFVLVSPEGSILFNGSPDDPDFWAALKQLSPEIKRPESALPTPEEP